MVETEIVDEYEKYFLPVVEEGEDFGFEKFRAHQGVLASGNPLFVVFLDEFGESAVGFDLLHGEQFVHNDLKEISKRKKEKNRIINT